MMTLGVSERAPDGDEKSLPIHVTAWEGVLGFDVKAKSVPSRQSEELQLNSPSAGQEASHSLVSQSTAQCS
jgi:hypothetical protein